MKWTEIKPGHRYRHRIERRWWGATRIVVQIEEEHYTHHESVVDPVYDLSMDRHTTQKTVWRNADEDDYYNMPDNVRLP